MSADAVDTSCAQPPPAATPADADIREQILKTFKVLHGDRPDLPAELRVLRNGPPLSGIFRDPRAFAEAAAARDDKLDENLYITLNPVIGRESMNHGVLLMAGKGAVAADDDIAALRSLLLDFDPVRESGIAATDAEKQCAKDQMEKASAFFTDLGWPAPVVADSGNGYHLLYAIDLPNDEGSKALVRAVIAAAAQRFSNAAVEVDKCVWNPSRITRLYGTENRKGENTPERPWRRSGLLSVPEQRVPVTREQLEEFANTVEPARPGRQPRQTHQQRTPQHAGAAAAVATHPLGSNAFDMKGFLKAANIDANPPTAYEGGLKWELKKCPFNPDHDRGEAAVFVDRDGNPGFNCFHASCQEYAGWRAFHKALRQLLEEAGETEKLCAIADYAERVGYYNRGGGLYFRSPDKPAMRLGDRLEILARVRCDDSSRWGTAVRWWDPDGTAQELVVSSSTLVTDANAELARLADRGYRKASHKGVKDRLVGYFNSPAPSAIRADSPGWHGEAYVFPDGPIGFTAEPVYFVRNGRVAAEYNVAGSLEEWQQQIGRYCVGNPRLVLAVCTGFAGPLLAPTNNETGGIHLRGGSSTGKTTALHVAGSVCGGGGTNGYIRQWRATTNGLEGVAAAHSDGLLILDELQQLSGRDVAGAVYMLANQAGKSRAMRDGAAAVTKHWRLMLLSSGELSLEEHAKQAGEQIRAGVEVRLLTVPADAGKGHGLFEELHGFPSPAAFADHLKRHAKSVYGTPLRAFLAWLCGNRAAALEQVVAMQDAFVVRHKPDGANGEVGRALRRFALLAAAGELATEAGVTGWVPGEAEKAAATCFRAWLDERGGTGSADIEKGIQAVQLFLETQGSRFQDVNSCNPIPINRVGFKRAIGNRVEYLVLKQAFRDVVCRGYDHKSIRDALIERGIMSPGSDMEHPGQVQRDLREFGKKKWVYAMEVGDCACTVQEFPLESPESPDAERSSPKIRCG